MSEFKKGDRVVVTGDVRNALHGLSPGTRGTLTGMRYGISGGAFEVVLAGGSSRYVHPQDLRVLEGPAVADRVDAEYPEDERGCIAGSNCEDRAAEATDVVNHPAHYTSHPSGVECIQVTEHMGFNLGNAVKYIWRADLKNDAIEDIKKSVWYLQRELDRRTRNG